MKDEEKKIWKDIGKQLKKDVWTIVSVITASCTITGISLFKALNGEIPCRLSKIVDNAPWILLIVIVVIFFRIVKMLMERITTKEEIDDKITTKEKTDNVEIVRIPFTDYLLEEFQYLKKEHKDDKIILLGKRLDRPLWLSYKYKARRDIGDIVLKSAIAEKDVSAEIKARIDMLGWTNVELMNYEGIDGAKFHLNEGIRLAEKELLNDNKNEKIRILLAKGYRHRLTLNFRLGNIIESSCNDDLGKSLAEISKIQSEEKKSELLVEHYFAEATYELKKRELTNTEEEIRSACLQAENAIKNIEEYYDRINDNWKIKIDDNWKIKINARKGDVLLALGELNNDNTLLYKAFELFTQEEKKAFDKHLNKPRVKCFIGLGDYYSKLFVKSQNGEERDKNYNDAKKNYTDAYDIADKICMEYEKSIIENKQKELENKK
jgi:hypothetical protein